MKRKHYTLNSSYIRSKCWRKYGIRRERALRQAAILLGELSYQSYMRNAIRLNGKKIDNLSVNTIKMLFVIRVINFDDLLKLTV